MISAALRRLLALALLGTAALAQAQDEPAVARRATELREAPAESARSIASLAADSPLTRTDERQGPWVRVRTAAGTSGWVHLFDLAPAGGSGGVAGAAAGALRGVTSFFSKPSAQRTTTATSTIGIRGLGAEDLAQATPDTAAVARLEALRVPEAQARQFARDAALQPQAVEPLPAPPRATAPVQGATP